MTNGGNRKRTLGEAFGANAWLNEEAGQSRFRDERLGIRFRLVPSACGRMSGRASDGISGLVQHESSLLVSVLSQGERSGHTEWVL